MQSKEEGGSRLVASSSCECWRGRQTVCIHLAPKCMRRRSYRRQGTTVSPKPSGFWLRWWLMVFTSRCSDRFSCIKTRLCFLQLCFLILLNRCFFESAVKLKFKNSRSTGYCYCMFSSMMLMISRPAAPEHARVHICARYWDFISRVVFYPHSWYKQNT